MTQRELSLTRLEQLTDYYRNTGRVRAVMAFGSCGAERERFDDYSDLDFLVICKDDGKQALLGSLSELSAFSPVEFCFIHYGDAVELMFHDGVFCDYGIVTQAQLCGIPHGDGKVLWCEEGFDEALCKGNIPLAEQPAREALVGEILTALYIGLCRDKRGERLIACQMIQVEAVNLLLKLYAADHKTTMELDAFSAGRRAEQNLPCLIMDYPRMMQGYEKNAASALAILNILNRLEPVHAFMAERIAQMCVKNT